MLKNILNLNGAQQLSKNEQMTVTGGCPIGLGEGRCSTNPAMCSLPNGECVPCNL